MAAPVRTQFLIDTSMIIDLMSMGTAADAFIDAMHRQAQKAGVRFVTTDMHIYEMTQANRDYLSQKFPTTTTLMSTPENRGHHTYLPALRPLLAPPLNREPRRLAAPSQVMLRDGRSRARHGGCGLGEALRSTT